jgi:plasmid stabilization system protein ParE
MPPLRVASVADQDTIRCAVWLEEQRVDLGNDFVDALERALVEIAERPNACPTLVLEGIQFKCPLRWLRLGRFPHVVIFESRSDEILVIAVAHPHQDLETLLRARIGTA